ncbi:SURF1 family protein [Schlegelella sp. S2-27]|uniref:SURF1-like protein n=1 Tax=Caldimonas mangrovi TaxID=2944811 RepID=A0ABT0YLK8_9BURK|nr:SURF1 family protein [Caldimonas mangrovi]MCM5678768.1 SURF1 family protein [Caldimonas mangrovi]
MSESHPHSSWRRWVVLAAALAGIAVTASLGRWQLGRAAQKEALQAAIDSRSRLPAVMLNETSRPSDADPALLHRPVMLHGHWVEQHTVFLDNRQMNGRPGFYVVTPLQLSGRSDAVLVQRGWAPRDVQDRTRLPKVPTPAGDVRLEGRIAPPPAKLYEFDGTASGPIRQNLDLASYEQEIGTSLWPVSVVQTAVANGGPDDGLLREWPAPAVDVHKHYGYAFQWFAMSALMAGLYVWFQLLRPRLRGAR